MSTCKASGTRSGQRHPEREASRRQRIEFGDFQTPPELAEAVCRLLARERPATVVEPTCGTGGFVAAARCFAEVRQLLAMDINPRHLASARERLSRSTPRLSCEFRVADFFHVDWPTLFAQLPEPILVVGNPPWVTSAALGVLGSRNHPRKENRQRRAGLDAMTGKSNFDVSEWMMVRLLEALRGRRGTLAMLCKTSVARKTLLYVWQHDLPVERAEIRRIDAARHFGARVDACLFLCRIGTRRAATDCRVFPQLASRNAERIFGLRDGRLVADVKMYDAVRHLVGGDFRWRSGVKHDCAAVFELERDGSRLVNGLEETVHLERRHLYPFLKSSHVASGNVANTSRVLLLPQKRVGEETIAMAARSPKTWDYLLRHAGRLDRRASRVYRNQPRFAVFGVGPYTFSDWKVAVSGLYKTWRFAPVGPIGKRPVVCDDTCYLLPCRSATEARARARLLNGDRAQDFLQAFVFPEAKRPLTAEILGLMDLEAIAKEVISPPRTGRAL